MSSLFAAAALLALSSTAMVAADTIRVAIAENVRSVELRGLNIEVSELGCAACPRGVWRTDTVRAVVNGQGVEIDRRSAAAFRLTSDTPIRMNGREYPATLEIVRYGEGLAIVNELRLEEYIVGVLRAETSEKWPAETLRAQAIVARTYAAFLRSSSGTRPYNIVATTTHQVYAGHVPASSPIWDAVRDTAGQVLLWDGELFPAFYHSASGGYTEDPRTVFAARNMPALKAIRDDFSTAAPHYYWTLDLKLGSVRHPQAKRLRRGHGDRARGYRAHAVAPRVEPDRPRHSKLVRAARQRLPPHGRLRDGQVDACSRSRLDGSVARFSGRGYGHGVGMSAVGRQGHGRAGIQGREDPRVLLSGDDARLARHAHAVTISWQDFEKVDMRVGVVTDAKEFPEARRPALRLWIDFGSLGDQALERADHRALPPRRADRSTGRGRRQLPAEADRSLRLGGPGARRLQRGREVILLNPDQPVAPGSKIG